MRPTADLTLDDFALFARLAQLRNLSALARERAVPASQVSRALARIERRCGVRLVHRSTHGLSLTDEGDAVAAHAARLLAEAQDLDDTLDQRRGDASGLVRVALSPAMALVLLPSLPALLERHPRLRLDFAAADPLIDMAREGIDVAIRTGVPVSDGLVARPLGQFGRALYAAPAYLARRGAPRHPDELAAHTLIGNSATPAFNRWPFAVDGARSELDVAGSLRTDNSGVAVEMAVAGLGIARLSDAVALPHVRTQRLVPVLADCTEPSITPVHAVMLPERQRALKVRVCVDHWVDWFARRNEEPG